ncbi:MAG: fatty acyl-AMP ligase [Longimicrobiales bacterium]
MLKPIRSDHDLPMRAGDFADLAEALDYASQGETGLNFFDARGRLCETLPYSELRERARSLARKLLGEGLSRGDRVACIAETGPDFAVLYFACQYAGMVPVALPIAVNVGGRAAYVNQLVQLLSSSTPSLAVAPDEWLEFLEEAGGGMPWLPVTTVAALQAKPEPDVELHPSRGDEAAYVQFTSGSTQFPRGVVISQAAVMDNLRCIVQHGLQIQPGDRSASWLPFYHDMGLVGFLLGPVASQVTIDYMRTRDFAMRPVEWLRLISRNRATIAFGPPIAYELCDLRLRPRDIEGLDLSSWRIAGVGAEMIRPNSLNNFAEKLAPAGFDRRAFLPCYGLAEASLAVAFPPLGEGPIIEQVDADLLSETGEARVAIADGGPKKEVVNCGMPVPGHEIAIRDETGSEVEQRQVGRVFVRGPSVMTGYFQDPDSTRAVLSEDGWLDTGDLGYMTDDGLYITGRAKDLIIVNGRNIWPEDLEHIAEQHPQVRVGDSSAFGLIGPDAVERAVLVVECRSTDPDELDALVTHFQTTVYEAMGINCLVEVVPPRTLPKTTSGKRSRDAARRGFLGRVGWHEPDLMIDGAGRA